MTILRYRSQGNFTTDELDCQIPPGFAATIHNIGPEVFVDIEVLPNPTATAQADLTEFLESLGWVFVATDPTTPTDPIGLGISVYDGTGGQAFTGTVQIVFDTVQKNMSTGLYTFDGVAGTIEVLEAGTYEITFDISLNLSGNQRTNSRSFLTRNAIEVAGTDAFGYHRNTAVGLDTSSMTTIMDLVANDLMAVGAQRLGASGTMLSVSEGSRFTIKRIG